MTKQERIHKLVNAVKRYRGAYDEQTKVWFRQPKKPERASVITWLQKIKVNNVEAAIQFIDKCKSWNEFNNWLALYSK
jgi:hypothetical protein